MKKISLFGLIAALAVGSLVWMGCEGAATPSVTNNYYPETGKPGLGDEDTLYLQYRPEIGYSVVTSLGSLQLELYAPSQLSGGDVKAIVYAGTGETLNEEIIIPDDKKLFIGYKISETAALGSLTIGENGSLVVGDDSGTADSFLYVAKGADPVTGSAVTLTKGGKIEANYNAGGSGAVRGATGVQIDTSVNSADQFVIASDKWDDVKGFNDEDKVYYFGTENIEVEATDYATVLETTGSVTVTGTATVVSLKAASVTVGGGGGVTLTGETLVSDVTLGTDAGDGGLDGYDVTGNVVIVESTTGTLDGVDVSGNVTAWGILVTDSNPVTVHGYVAIDAGATVGANAALGVYGNVYICDGVVAISGVGDDDGLNTLGTIYVNDGLVAFHTKFGGAVDADIVLKAAAGATETSGYARVAGATITANADTNTGATIETDEENGGIYVGAQSTIGSGIWLEAGSYTATDTNTSSVTFTGGSTPDVSIAASDELTIAGDNAEIKTTSASAPVTTFSAGVYTNDAGGASGVASSGIVTINTTLTTDGTISTTLIDDIITRPTVPYGLTAGTGTLAKMRGTGTVYVKNTAAIDTTPAAASASTELVNVGPLGTINGITLVLPQGIIFDVSTGATLTGATIEVGDYSVTGGTITLTGAGATAEITPANGIKVTGAAAAALTFTGAIATPALHITGTAVLNTDAAGTSIVSIKASGTASAPVTTVSVTGDSAADLTAGTIVLGNSATDTTYVFTGSAVPGTPTHSGTPDTAYPFVTLANGGSTIPAGTSATLNGVATLTGLTVGGLLDVKAVTTLGVITLTGTLELPAATTAVVTTGAVTTGGAGVIHVAGTTGNFRASGATGTTIQTNAVLLAAAKATLGNKNLALSNAKSGNIVTASWTNITYAATATPANLTGAGGTLGNNTATVLSPADDLVLTVDTSFTGTAGGTVSVGAGTATINNLILDTDGYVVTLSGTWSL